MAAYNAVGLEQGRIPIEAVFKQLKCTKEGLTSEEGANRLQIFGPNKLEDKRAWDTITGGETALTSKKDYGRQEREAQWAFAQRTVHGLQPLETTNLFTDKSSYHVLSEKRRAEIARLHELHALEGRGVGIMDMRKISCAVIIAAASATAVLASEESLVPAPGPTSGSTAAAPALGLVTASLMSLVAFYLH
ncbi:hypothetical protein MRB53_012295 [Persea americana]|uniref:Uncharacterized protein n=1 Tax=Persea americana TaxID=3435 RepID=A0ACC2LXT8_PERAE|nr:hypothetical protein MRB53_012295 [Persea americana]